MAGLVVPPTFKGRAFTCLHCSTLTSMAWAQLIANPFNNPFSSRFWLCQCLHCRESSVWGAESESAAVTTGRLVYPHRISAPAAHEDLPEQCRADFEEARQVYSFSPRASAALLRLCLQRLLVNLGGAGVKIDTDIKTLVANGLDSHIQQALDVIRVTGNQAVHPSEMNTDDDQNTVLVLFEMINMIVDELVRRPKSIQKQFDSLPLSVREAIERRDATKPKPV